MLFLPLFEDQPVGGRARNSNRIRISLTLKPQGMKTRKDRKYQTTRLALSWQDSQVQRIWIWVRNRLESCLFSLCDAHTGVRAHWARWGRVKSGSFTAFPIASGRKKMPEFNYMDLTFSTLGCSSMDEPWRYNTQTQRDNSCVTPFIWGIWGGSDVEKGSRREMAGGWGRGKWGLSFHC